MIRVRAVIQHTKLACLQDPCASASPLLNELPQWSGAPPMSSLNLDSSSLGDFSGKVLVSPDLVSSGVPPSVLCTSGDSLLALLSGGLGLVRLGLAQVLYIHRSGRCS
jgi:hypothetical protein